MEGCAHLLVYRIDCRWCCRVIVDDISLLSGSDMVGDYCLRLLPRLFLRGTRQRSNDQRKQHGVMRSLDRGVSCFTVSRSARAFAHRFNLRWDYLLDICDCSVAADTRRDEGSI